MLFNPNWEQETKADPFTMPALIAWLEKMPADQEYNYTSPRRCLLCQYFEANGFPNVLLSRGDFQWGPKHEFSGFQPAVFDDIAQIKPRTFGAALERARALQARSGE